MRVREVGGRAQAERGQLRLRLVECDARREPAEDLNRWSLPPLVVAGDQPERHPEL